MIHRFFRNFSDVYSVSTWYPASIPEIFTELSNEITRHIKQAQEVKMKGSFVLLLIIR